MQLLDRYRIEALVGQGGMSLVFRGEDERLHRPVAIKIFSLPATDRARLPERHFVQEAFALSQLRHPNTIRIFDFGTFVLSGTETPFQVAEYMEDGTLTARVKEKGPLQREAARRIVEAISGALSEAHALEVIHRDIKPCNILFGRAGRQRIVKLADFGVALAKARVLAVLEDATIATTGSFFSLGWSAPEQLRGQVVDRTADIYGLGLVLGFMLLGERLRRLAPGPDLLKSFETLDEELSAAIRAQAVLRGAIGEVIMMACQARPERRFQTVEALAEAADRALRPAKRATGPSATDSEAPTTLAPSDSAEVAVASKREAPRAPSSPTLAIDRLLPGVLVAGGHRLRVVETKSEVDLEFPAAAAPGVIRIRGRFSPSIGPKTRLHVRGMNCFLHRSQQPPTSGLDFASDGQVELQSPDHRLCLSLEVALGEKEGERWRVAARGLELSLPISEVSELAILSASTAEELVLIYRSQE